MQEILLQECGALLVLQVELSIQPFLNEREGGEEWGC